MTRILFIFLIIFLSVTANLHAEISKVKGGEPISVKSDQLRTDAAGRSALFSGKVVATQGDLVIYCDSLTVIYASARNYVKEVVAEGNVRIVQGSRLAYAGKAVYDNQKGLIRLENRPKVQQDNDTITGAMIIYDVNENKSTISSGSGQRVEAVINPSGTVLSPAKK